MSKDYHFADTAVREQALSWLANLVDSDLQRSWLSSQLQNVLLKRKDFQARGPGES